MQRIRVITWGVVAIVMLGGCLDLKAVRQFSDSSAQASKPLTDIVLDMYDSCERRNSYAPEAQKADCSKHRQNREKVIGTYGILDDYITALGQLASDETIDYDKSFDKVVSELKGAGVGDDQARAAGGLAAFLTKAATDGYRKTKVKEAITTQNDNLKLVSAALSDIVGRDYKRLLDQEKFAIESYYGPQIKEAAFSPSNSQDPLAKQVDKIGETVGRSFLFALTKDSEEKLREVTKKHVAVQSYLKILRSIEDGHQTLYDSKDNLDAKALIQQVSDYAKNLEVLKKDVQKAFK
jgi:hypothetical protein